jgi:hypothetical protein
MLIKREPEPQGANYAAIVLSSKYCALLDLEDYDRLCRYQYRPKRKKKKIYAVRRYKYGGKTYEIAMHNEIMNPPKGYDVHHKKHNTLDNRKSELEIVPHNEHPHF